MRKESISAAIAALMLMSSCSAAARVQSVDNTFLADVDVSKKLQNLPFDHSWVWSDRSRDDYAAVCIKPVRTDTLNQKNWSRSASAFITSSADYNEKANEVANHFQQKLIEEINTKPNHRYQVVENPTEGVIVVEFALTELEFSHPIARAGALASPVPGTGAALSAISDPHAAFAMRMTDGSTGELLVTAADRKFPPTRVVDLNKMTVSSSPREVCQNWAKEFAEALNEGRFGEVKSVGVFSILPW